jgi:hypothetical protein
LWALGLYRPEDRRVLEDVIVPHYRQDPAIQRILIAGVTRPGRHYPSLFAGKECITIDLDSKRARYGASHHIIDRLENLGNHIAAEWFDLIVVNGLIGFGIDDLSNLETAVHVCHRHLRHGGELLLSTDAGRPGSELLPQVQALREGFIEATVAPFGASSVVTQVPWHPRPEHIYHFFRRI